jgi:hypothetical protein
MPISCENWVVHMKMIMNKNTKMNMDLDLEGPYSCTSTNMFMTWTCKNEKDMAMDMVTDMYEH